MHNTPTQPASLQSLAKRQAPSAEITGGSSNAIVQNLKGMPGVPSIDAALQYTFAPADCLLPPFTENLAA